VIYNNYRNHDFHHRKVHQQKDPWGVREEQLWFRGTSRPQSPQMVSLYGRDSSLTSHVQDPYFEQVPATRLDGRPSSKTKKVRKALPAGISEHDGKVLTKVKRRAYRLDMSLFNCCGLRFGWSSVIGIIPG
jgi:hypothetical protein